MKTLSWNIAGIRASLKRNDFDFLKLDDYEIVCIQETKATVEEAEKVLPEWIKEMYKFRFWKSTEGVTQRKGFSGTCIWSKNKPENEINPPEIDCEGRVTCLKFEKFHIVNVYTPNSQNINSERCVWRLAFWDSNFREYISKLNNTLPTIICGDFNVANEEIDIWGGAQKHDGKTCIGFLDEERLNFKEHLKLGYVDAFRFLNKEGSNYTYWDQRMPWLRKQNKGWRIDYFLVPKKLESMINNSLILKEIEGSDHCPISLDININYEKINKLKIVNEFSN